MDSATSQISSPASQASDSKPAFFQGLDVGAWGWLGGLRSWSNNGDSYYWDAEASINATKSFNGKAALTVQYNFIDANNLVHGELEQAYGSVLVLDRYQTSVAVGKFNANIGIEARDFWNRQGGTTSLLFGAEPQDMAGLMITQPIPGTDFTIRPFVTEGLEGTFDFGKTPSWGLIAEYRPNEELELCVTNFFGPGYKPTMGLARYYDQPELNWPGPSLDGVPGGTLYLLDVRGTWSVTTNLTLGAEYLYAANSASPHGLGWTGFLIQGNYTIDEHWRTFARWSYLNDSGSLVTGDTGLHQELSGGIAYMVDPDLHLEIRAEYRHDFTSYGDHDDVVSIHLSLGV
jgi:hypothetical protein